VNRTEYFIAIAMLGALVDIKNPTGYELVAYCFFIGFAGHRWFNAMREEQKP
jgi:hypothetical protein